MSKYIELVCGCCGVKFSRLLKQYKYAVKTSGEGYTPICSNECLKRFRYKKQTVICEKSFEKSFHEIKNTQHNFCSCSCSAIFNNKNRTTSVKTKELKKIAAIAAVYKFIEETTLQQVEYAVPEEVSAWKTGSRMLNFQATQIRNQLR